MKLDIILIAVLSITTIGSSYVLIKILIKNFKRTKEEKEAIKLSNKRNMKKFLFISGAVFLGIVVLSNLKSNNNSKRPTTNIYLYNPPSNPNNSSSYNSPLYNIPSSSSGIEIKPNYMDFEKLKEDWDKQDEKRERRDMQDKVDKMYRKQQYGY